MAKLNKYKTFTELKESIEKTSVTKSQLDYMTKDLNNFVKKIRSFQKI